MVREGPPTSGGVVTSGEGRRASEPAKEDRQAALGRLNGAIGMQIGRSGQAPGVGLGEQFGLVVLGGDQEVDLGGLRSVLSLSSRSLVFAMSLT
jgi:hypothetical protein